MLSLGWFLKLDHMELMVNCYNGLKIFYPIEDSECVWGVAFQIGWTYLVEYCKEVYSAPVLFLVYINDLPDSILSNLYMFADVIFYKTWITSQTGTGYRWWILILTNIKFYLRHTSFYSTEIATYSMTWMTYYDGLYQLIRVEEEKDLGVLLSSTLKFSHYVKEIVHKANRLLASLTANWAGYALAEKWSSFLSESKASVRCACL